MRIRVKDEDTNLRLWMPTGLLLSRPIAAAVAKGARDKGIPLTGRQLNTLFKAIRRYRKAHRDWVLVEVDSQNGDKVLVKL